MLLGQAPRFFKKCGTQLQQQVFHVGIGQSWILNIVLMTNIYGFLGHDCGRNDGPTWANMGQTLCRLLPAWPIIHVTPLAGLFIPAFLWLRIIYTKA